MSHPVPPAPSPDGRQNGAPQYGSVSPSDGSGYGSPAPAFGAQAPAFGSPANGDQGHAGYGTGGDGIGGQQPPTPPRKKWPLWVGLGCGCLLILVLAIIAVVVLISSSGGDDDGPTAGPTGTTVTSSPSTSAAPSTTSAAPTTTAPPTTDAPLPVTPEDEQAAKQTMVDLSKALVNGDVNAVCGLIIDPVTGQGFSGPRLETCSTQLGGQVQGGTEQQKQGIAGMTTDQVTTRVNDDGTITATSEFATRDYKVVRTDDGRWLVSLQDV